MEFELFSWPEPRSRSTTGPLRQPTGTDTDLLLYDAIQCGLHPYDQLVWGAILRIENHPAVSDPGQVVIVGECIQRIEDPFYIDLTKEAGKPALLRPWHIAARLLHSPLEYHFKWRPGEQPQSALLNAQSVQTKQQLEDVWRILLIVQNIVPKGGRPEGKTTRPLEEKRKAVSDIEEYKRRYRTTYRIAAARIYRMEGQEDNAYKQFQRDRKDVLKG